MQQKDADRTGKLTFDSLCDVLDGMDFAEDSDFQTMFSLAVDLGSDDMFEYGKMVKDGFRTLQYANEQVSLGMY